MTRNNQKWYDKPFTKLILITIALTWIFPVFGFVLSSFRPGEAIKRESWWDAIYTGKLWTELTLSNYSEIFFADNLDRSFYNSFAVTIPSTIIPITIAAFAAYAFAFMEFRGKEPLFLLVVASMIIPLQMSLIPLVQLFKSGVEIFGIPLIPALDINGTFVATWFAHTGFGLPLATFLLRDFMMSLPKSVIESAKIDGASNITTFFKLVLPLSVAGIAAFGTFQFLWVYNDFLVANVFLGVYKPENLVVTSHVSQLAVGAYGEAWHLRTSGAIISMIVPLIVFFSLQWLFSPINFLKKNHIS